MQTAKKNLVSQEDKIEQLKADYQITLYELDKCRDHLELKEEALATQDKCIIQLKDTIEKLKIRIQKLLIHGNSSNHFNSDEENALNKSEMVLPDLLMNL
ncbi:hypothetical protein C1645_818171 [Glomus cerebriforme]|uniref:Uncharacterized protein n=1 Tax=Glomus cerebriforme TaxID=658196 RepID=A0A397T8Z3_9GLOM|nr:hypothetical protein C1645_818171 [Glomus cerebriforme]